MSDACDKLPERIAKLEALVDANDKRYTERFAAQERAIEVAANSKGQVFAYVIGVLGLLTAIVSLWTNHRP